MSECKGVFVLTHGLNNNAFILQDLKNALEDRGFKTLIVVLTGHQKNKPPNKHIEKSDWIKDAKEGLKDGAKIARENNCPLFALGFSLGALTTAIAVQDKSINCSGIVLASPAIAIKPYVKLIKIFKKLPFLKNTCLQHRDYFVHKSIPASYYNVMLSMEKDFKAITGKELNEVPTLLISSEKDEVISYKQLFNLIKSKKLTNWHLVDIKSKKEGGFKDFYHLSIVKKFLEPKDWKRLVKSITRFTAKAATEPWE